MNKKSARDPAVARTFLGRFQVLLVEDQLSLAGNLEAIHRAAMFNADLMGSAKQIVTRDDACDRLDRTLHEFWATFDCD